MISGLKTESLCGAIILVLLLSLIVAGRRAFVYKRELERRDAVSRIEGFNVQRYYYVENVMFGALRYGGKAAGDFTVTDTCGNSFSVKRILGERPEMCLVYRDSDCPSCIHYALLRLKEFTASAGCKATVLADYDQAVKLKITASQYGGDGLSFYRSVFGNDSFARLQTPCFLVLGQDLRVSDVFLPDKSFPAVTDRYLELMREKYRASGGD